MKTQRPFGETCKTVFGLAIALLLGIVLWNLPQPLEFVGLVLTSAALVGFGLLVLEGRAK